MGKGTGEKLHAVLTLALDGQLHTPAALSLVKNPSIHSTGGWVGRRAGTDRW
jgi:hypothetical protein